MSSSHSRSVTTKAIASVGSKVASASASSLSLIVSIARLRRSPTIDAIEQGVSSDQATTATDVARRLLGDEPVDDELAARARARQRLDDGVEAVDRIAVLVDEVDARRHRSRPARGGRPTAVRRAGSRTFDGLPLPKSCGRRSARTARARAGPLGASSSVIARWYPSAIAHHRSGTTRRGDAARSDQSG